MFLRQCAAHKDDAVNSGLLTTAAPYGYHGAETSFHPLHNGARAAKIHRAEAETANGTLGVGEEDAGSSGGKRVS